MMNVEKEYLKQNFLKKLKITDFIDLIFSVIIIIFSNFEIFKLININFSRYLIFIILNAIICAFSIYKLIYSINLKIKLILVEYRIESLEENNNNLIEVNDLIRCFKHDFNNIIQTIDACIDIEDYETLKNYFSSLMKECNHMNLLDRLNSKAKENPAIYSMLISKYRLAKQKQINMNIDVLIDLKKFNKKTYKISRMLGILLDNALEASEECENKTINVQMYKENVKNNRVSIVIENTYKDKDVDTNKIFEKNYSTKKEKGNNGLGLWKVNDIIKKDNTLDLYTTKDNLFFKQQIEFYDDSDVDFVIK